MKKKKVFGIIGGCIGLLLGLLGGAYLGMVVGGTFFGWLEFPNYPGLTGYELGTYLGGAFGLLIGIPLGVITGYRRGEKS